VEIPHERDRKKKLNEQFKEGCGRGHRSPDSAKGTPAKLWREIRRGCEERGEERADRESYQEAIEKNSLQPSGAGV